MLLALVASVAAASADDAIVKSLERQYEQQITPLIQTHCQSCHDAKTHEADLDLTIFRRLQDVSGSHLVWQKILERVQAGEMPPADATNQLSDKDRRVVVQWIRALRQFDAASNAGDPGNVLVRRLSNSEYDYSIRDLTGIDIRPTKTFPIDPANEAGFDNSGESLMMSSALISKYLQAARTVVDHLVLTPRGIRFAPHPVVTDTDRDKYCVKRIVAFYQRQPTNYTDYFYAAWIYRHRQAFGMTDASLDEVAIGQSVSPKYLATLWHALSEQTVEIGPLATLQEMWRHLPALPHCSLARHGCTVMSDYVVSERKRFEPTFENLSIEGIHKGSQAFVLWKNKQYAAHRRLADFAFLDQPQGQAEVASPDDCARDRPLGSGEARSLHHRLPTVLRDLSRCVLHLRTRPRLPGHAQG